MDGIIRHIVYDPILCTGASLPFVRHSCLGCCLGNKSKTTANLST